MNFTTLHPEVIKNAKNIYFEMWNIVDDKSRVHNLVRARAAFSVAFRPYCRLVDLSAVLDKHHSSVAYYIKIHDAQMMYGDYQTMYASARNLLSMYDKGHNLLSNHVENYGTEPYSLENILHELDEANKKVEELLKYKYRYDEIVARVKELV